MQPQIISLDERIEITIKEKPSTYLSRSAAVLANARDALEKRKTLIWVEGPLGCGKSTLTEKLAQELNLYPYKEEPEQAQIRRYLQMLYHSDKEVRKIGAVGVNNAYFPHRMHQYSEALMRGKSCILDRIIYADEIYMEMFIDDGLMTREQFEEIRSRRKQEMKLIMPKGITTPQTMIIQIIGDAETFYEMKNGRAENGDRHEESESNGGGIPIDYMQKLNERYARLAELVYKEGFTGPILQITQSLDNNRENKFNIANERHLTPIYEAIVDYLNKNKLSFRSAD